MLKSTAYEESLTAGITCLDLNGSGYCDQAEPGIVGVTAYDPPALTVEVQQIPLPMRPGKDVTFQITLTNTGGNDAVNVGITNNMPEGFTNQDGSTPPCIRSIY